MAIICQTSFSSSAFQSSRIFSLLFLITLTCHLATVLKAEKEIESNDIQVDLKSTDAVNADTVLLEDDVQCNESQDTYSTTISGLSSDVGKSQSCSARSRATVADPVQNDPRMTELRETILKEQEAHDRINAPKTEDANGNSVCSIYVNQIITDLKPFSGGITRSMFQAARGRGVLYQIENGKLYREKECRFPSRCSGVQYFIKKISKDLPDMEFFINVSDWPQVSNRAAEAPPVFSFSRNDEYIDIMYPAWTFWEGGPAISLYPQGIGRWDKMRKLLLDQAKKIPWNEKKPIGFFRGSRTSKERDPLVILSRKRPDLVDAMYTKNQAWKSEKDTLNAPPASEVSLESHCAYKYLFNYRGVAASFRFKHLFLCRSLVFQVGDEWQEFFYTAMQPWVHYVPVDKDAREEDLEFLLTFFKQNDDIAEAIADAGYKFIKSNLELSHVKCYWKELLMRYSRLVKYTVAPAKDMLFIN